MATIHSPRPTWSRAWHLITFLFLTHLVLAQETFTDSACRAQTTAMNSCAKRWDSVNTPNPSSPTNPPLTPTPTDPHRMHQVQHRQHNLARPLRMRLLRQRPPLLRRPSPLRRASMDASATVVPRRREQLSDEGRGVYGQSELGECEWGHGESVYGQRFAGTVDEDDGECNCGYNRGGEDGCGCGCGTRKSNSHR
jgi:hypothetical protein